MAAPRKIDYESIEPGWRAGIQSPHQLAAEYTARTGVSVSHAAIIKHFKKRSVPRNLAAKIKAKAEAMVTTAMVTGKVTQLSEKSEAEIVEVNAQAEARIRLTHRTDIGRARTLVMKLFGELEGVTDNIDLVEQLAAAIAEDSPKRAEALLRITSLTARAGTLDKLATSLKTLVGLEREAFNMDEGGGGGDDPIDKMSREELEATFVGILDRARVIDGEVLHVSP